ncbi:MAG: hypothetical protein OFPI_18550 [Osedax symbiont Rs2]|nr:MAG: hypothetical protein OFPI_18550 [Osedax symbiont Rs2]
MSNLTGQPLATSINYYTDKGAKVCTLIAKNLPKTTICTFFHI